MPLRRSTTAAVLAAIAWLLSVAAVGAEETARVSGADPNAASAAENEGTPAAGEAAVPEESLAMIQDRIAARFERFQETLLKMSEQIRKTDPERAELLIRALGKSKTDRIGDQMRRVIELLKKPGDEQFGDAVTQQNDVVNNLQALLGLLQSEDRRSEIEKEKERLKDLIKDLNRLIGKEKDVRAATERGENPDQVAGKQGKVADETQELIRKIDQQDADRKKEAESRDGTPARGDDQPGDGQDAKPGETAKPEEGKPSEGKPSEGKPSEGKPSEGKPSEGKPSEGKPSEGKPSEGKPSEGKPSDEKPSDGDSGDQQPGSEDPRQTPGRQDIEQARKEMERAIQELKQKEADVASKHQDEAVAQLRAAKEKLEEILRQLREEERKLLLQALEVRFQKMLAMQLLVYNETVRLGKVPDAEFQPRHRSQATKLFHDEEAIALEASKALTLLKQEGSSVAFPEAIEQLRDDMLSVARYLELAKVGPLTQGIEKDIIEALEELIEALQKEIEKSDEEKQQQQQQQQQQQPQEPPLVDVLSELKMLRSLQSRINRRTRSLGNLIEGEQATEPDVVEQLQELSRRQSRIQEATHNLATGRNR